ncbi:MAG: hypothetical protein DRJ40_07435 [Thermoprotei archaeon]|nr:MAG: hypothetical protein DRJ40_07435 [Thermoprotei archaeon]
MVVERKPLISNTWCVLGVFLMDYDERYDEHIVVDKVCDYLARLVSGYTTPPEVFGLSKVLSLKTGKKCPRCGSDLIFEEYVYDNVSGIVLRCDVCLFSAVTDSKYVSRYISKRQPTRHGKKLNPVSAAIHLLHRAMSRVISREGSRQGMAMIVIAKVSPSGKMSEKVIKLGNAVSYW